LIDTKKQALMFCMRACLVSFLSASSLPENPGRLLIT